MDRNSDLIEKLHDHLFERKSTRKYYLSEKEEKCLVRVSVIYNKMLDDPLISEQELRNFLNNEFSVSRATAFNDVAIMKSLFGNVKKASKEYHRHRVIGMLEKAAEMALANDDYQGIINAAKEIGRYTRLDQNDLEEIPWSEIIPPSFEPTSDIKVLGFERNRELIEWAKNFAKSNNIKLRGQGNE